MKVLEFSDAHHFLERARDFLFRDEIAHNLILSSALALSKAHSKSPSVVRALTFLVAFNEKLTVEGVALRTPQNRWILSIATQDSAEILAREIQKREDARMTLRSLMIPAERAHHFSRFRHVGPAYSLNFMTVSKLKTIVGAPGMIRLAAAKDMKLLQAWSQLSAKESQFDESPEEAAEIILKYFDHRQLFVWENEGRLQAMAAVGGFTPKVTRISQVYTDAKARGRGYAATLVHRLSHRLLSEGSITTCALFADAKNFTTKHIYEKLGYRTAASFTELRHVTQTQTFLEESRGLSVTTTG